MGDKSVLMEEWLRSRGFGGSKEPRGDFSLMVVPIGGAEGPGDRVEAEAAGVEHRDYRGHPVGFAAELHRCIVDGELTFANQALSIRISIGHRVIWRGDL